MDKTLGNDLVDETSKNSGEKGTTPPQAEVVQKPIPGAPQETPPIPPQQATQILQTMVQAGFMAAPPLQPEVVKHVTEFLSHDSDNRLTSTDHEGHRRLIFRMTALIIGGISALALLALPFVAVLKGDATFATGFLDRHIPYLVALVMALLGGAGLKQILK